MADSCRQKPAKFEANLSTTAKPHEGGFVWKNSAELVWLCDEDCQHPSHERPG